MSQETATEPKRWHGRRHVRASVLLSLLLVLAAAFLAARAWRARSQPNSQLHAARPLNRDAQELYLQGKHFLTHRGGATRETQMESVALFEKAIEKDPSFALAYAGLASAYNGMAHSEVLNYIEAFSKAKIAAKKALEINPNLAEAHAALADTLVELDWDWSDAGTEFRRAIDLDANSPLVHFAYARYLAKLARFPEAIAEANIGLQLDPTSLVAYHMVAYCNYGARQYDKGLEEIGKAAELNLISPNSYIHWDIGILYLQKNKLQKAIGEFRTLGDLSTPTVLGFLGNAYARAGQRSEALQSISNLKEFVAKEGIGTYEIALVYTGIGCKDDAFSWLEKSYKLRDKNITYLLFEPALDSLRSDLRFRDLVRRVGLPD